jgi:hypothetical protein
MILSDVTIGVLKNFSTINPSLLFRKGNVIKTISPQKTILARAEVLEHFPRDFAIYDVPRFLGVLSLFNTPEISFGEKEATITDDNRKLTYVYSDATLFTTPPEKDVSLTNPDIVFDLSAVDLQNVLKASAVLQLPEVVVYGDSGSIFVSSDDTKNPSTDSYEVEVAPTDKIFKAIFKTENLKMFHNDYEVSISSKGIAQFTSNKLTYWAAVESHSTF